MIYDLLSPTLFSPRASICHATPPPIAPLIMIIVLLMASLARRISSGMISSGGSVIWPGFDAEEVKIQESNWSA
jgi:hypothetical protein